MYNVVIRHLHPLQRHPLTTARKRVSPAHLDNTIDCDPFSVSAPPPSPHGHFTFYGFDFWRSLFSRRPWTPTARRSQFPGRAHPPGRRSTCRGPPRCSAGWSPRASRRPAPRPRPRGGFPGGRSCRYACRLSVACRVPSCPSMTENRCEPHSSVFVALLLVFSQSRR